MADAFDPLDIPAFLRRTRCIHCGRDESLGHRPNCTKSRPFFECPECGNDVAEARGHKLSCTWEYRNR